MLNYIKKNSKDMVGYITAGVIMTVVGYIISIIIYDFFDIRAVYGFWIMLIPYSILKYLVFKKVWKKNIECPECGYKGVER